jgi:hypothetical protein
VHHFAGGGDPAEAILRYRDRLLLLHLKDVIDEPMGTEECQKYPFRFVVQGRGRIDFPGVFAALNRIRFHGWAVIELDSVPDNSTTPMEAAELSKAYSRKKTGHLDLSLRLLTREGYIKAFDLSVVEALRPLQAAVEFLEQSPAIGQQALSGAMLNY